MPRLAVTVIGVDRPGILARITGLLREAGANLADSTATILGGHCATMMLVDAPDAVDADVLADDLTSETADLGLSVTAREIGPGSPSRPATHVLNLYGADRPGIVHDVTSLVADHGVNVTDIATRLLHGEQPVYALQLEVAAGEPTDVDEVVADLREQVPDMAVHAEPLAVATL